MSVRGVRGAISVEEDNSDLILAATTELLNELVILNPELKTDDICSALFTLTDDLNSVYPALAARMMGWNLVPMMCAREIPVPNSLPKCIRVLIHWNTNIEQQEIKHVYLRRAVILRPDLAK
ncbi:MAG: chorismate mutase [Chloroflexota bacterium]